MSEEAVEPPLMKADETLSPVDLAIVEPQGHALLWTTLTIATAALLLLPTNAVTLDGWAKELPPSQVAEQVTVVTGRWLELTDRYGLGIPRAWLHAQWKRLETAKFQ